MSSAHSKFLIIGPSWVGDMVMAQSLFAELKNQQADCQIEVLAPAWTAALLDRMPEVNALINSDFKHGELALNARLKLAKKLRNNHYTHAIVLPNSLKSALVPWLAKIPIRIGWRGEQRWGLLNDIRKLDKHAYPMTVQRFVALGQTPNAPPPTLKSITKPQLRVTRQQTETVLSQHRLTQPLLILCPGAEFGSSKQWPASYYAQLAKHYLGENWQVCLLGSAKDAEICQTINAQTQHACTDLSAQTSLPEAVDVMSCANLVVSNDSGLMHIAAALQKPLVAIYGSTDPNHTPPLNPNHLIARLNLPCSPCFKRECPLAPSNGRLDCLKQLLPHTVIAHTQSLLEVGVK